MGTLTQYNRVIVGILITALSFSLITSMSNLTEKVSASKPLQQAEYIRISDGLMDACTQTGYSYSSCQSMLYGSNPGGYCNYLDYCPPIQDPGYTYSDPYGAMRDSQQKSGQIDNYIQQWDYLYPPGWSR